MEMYVMGGRWTPKQNNRILEKKLERFGISLSFPRQKDKRLLVFIFAKRNPQERDENINTTNRTAKQPLALRGTRHHPHEWFLLETEKSVSI